MARACAMVKGWLCKMMRWVRVMVLVSIYQVGCWSLFRNSGNCLNGINASKCSIKCASETFGGI